VAYLLEGSAEIDVNHQGYLGNTALSRAARHGHLEVVKVLLAAPTINPDIANEKLQFPLHFAAFQRQTEVVQAMLASGKCDTTVTDRKGRTPAEDTKDEGIREMFLAARTA
jgi:ankyrin repeat protein